MNKRTYIIGGVVLGLGVIGYIVYKKITKPVIVFGDVDSIDSTPNPPKETIDNSGLPLKRGSKGEKVKQLQRFLIAEGYDIGRFGINRDGVDGDFGSRTEQAVIENQQPFNTFKSMYPSAVRGQVSADFYNLNIKGRY